MLAQNEQLIDVAMHTITINLDDANEFAPKFSQPKYRFNISAESPDEPIGLITVGTIEYNLIDYLFIR